jgi:purine-binding chemotaxis protein CheW
MNRQDELPGRFEAGPATPLGVERVAESQTLMVLRLGRRWFAMDVRAIEEVALQGQVTRVPMSPPHILGVVMLRGRLTAVVGLEQMVGGAGMLPSGDMATLPRLLVVREGGYEMAIVAEEIHGIIEHAPPDAAGVAPAADAPDFVLGEFEWQGQRVSLLEARLLVAAAARLAGVASPWQDAVQ